MEKCTARAEEVFWEASREAHNVGTKNEQGKSCLEASVIPVRSSLLTPERPFSSLAVHVSICSSTVRASIAAGACRL